DGALADADRLGTRHRSIDQNHELIAPEPRGGVDRAHCTLQPLRYLAQQIIARTVTEGVVDELEAIEIDHEQREFMSLPVRLGDRLRHAVIEQQAVGKASERIV